MAYANRPALLRKAIQGGAVLCLAGLFCLPGSAAEVLTLAEFKKLHQQLQPPEGELWQTIPWQMSVLEARALATREKKPIIMRVRAGHPLGCV